MGLVASPMYSDKDTAKKVRFPHSVLRSQCHLQLAPGAAFLTAQCLSDHSSPVDQGSVDPTRALVT